MYQQWAEIYDLNVMSRTKSFFRFSPVIGH